MENENNETDIFGDLKFTEFGDRTAFGKELDKDLSRAKADTITQSNAKDKLIDAEGKEKSDKLIADNKTQKDNLDTAKTETDKIHNEYKTNSADRRAEAEGLVTNQRKAAGLQASIAAAKANQGGRLSISQLTSINTDITNQFTTSLNNAIKDNINFQTDLDSKLSNMGFSTIDKKRVIDELKKVLVDEETAPLIDAIATKYTSRKEFLKVLGDTVKGIHDAQIKDSSDDIQRSEGSERDSQAFKAMSNEEKARDIRDRFGNTWNVLTRSQKQDIINDTVSGKMDYAETLDLISNYKDQAIQNKQERLATIGGSKDTDLTESIYQGSSIKGFSRDGTTTRDNNYTGESTTSRADPTPKSTVTASRADPTPKREPASKKDPTPKKRVAPREKDTSTGYKVGSVTFTSKADYDLIKSRTEVFRALRKSDPAKYKRIMAGIKKRYTI